MWVVPELIGYRYSLIDFSVYMEGDDFLSSPFAFLTVLMFFEVSFNNKNIYPCSGQTH